MKSLRFVLPLLLVSLCAAAYAQDDAQKSFKNLKTLAGTWEGKIAGTGSEVDGKAVQVTLRVTSMGNVLMHEIRVEGRPDNPITMIYLDEKDQLQLVHYCDAGNRPRMAGKTLPDGNLDFEFLDISGDTKYGHMHHAKFTMIDADHHIQDWVFMEGTKPVPVHLDLKRSKVTSAGLQ